MIGLEWCCPTAPRYSRRPELDFPGYDLTGLFVGSEGTLGIATVICLRLVPKPEAVRTLLVFFGSTVQAGEAVARISGGDHPGSDRDDGQPLDPRRRGATNVGYPAGRRGGALVELDGSEAEFETRFEDVIQVCGAGRRHVRVAKDETERELIWADRKAASGPWVITPNYYTQDSVVPRSTSPRCWPRSRT